VIAWGNGTGEAAYALTNILTTVDNSKGQGASNWGHYSNPLVDKALADSTAEFDEAKRRKILQDSVQIVSDDGKKVRRRQPFTEKHKEELQVTALLQRVHIWSRNPMLCCAIPRALNLFLSPVSDDHSREFARGLVKKQPREGLQCCRKVRQGNSPQFANCDP
jgi:hypothetical protein